jgi:hypothetical protein
MKYPKWQDFEAKYSENPQGAFESLCRMLFRRRYGIGGSLPYFYNNAGNETVPIEAGKDVVGFQAKFFAGETLDSNNTKQIKHSIERAHAHYPSQNKLIVYTNLVFGNPPEGKTMTNLQKDVEDTANANGMAIEWQFGDNILDAVAQDELMYNLFFNLDVDLIHLDEYVKNANKLYERTIKDVLYANDRELSIGRESENSQLDGFLKDGKNVILQGESGCGKSAIVKTYCSNHPDLPVVWLNAGQFDTDDVNALFHLERSFTLGQVRQFYKECDQKLIIVDSAEKLLDIKNKIPMTLFVGSMMQDAWQFVFTVRKSGMEQLSKLLRETFELVTEALDVPALTSDVLDAFLKNNRIGKPADDRLYELIHNLFYLARYTDIASDEQLTVGDYRNKVWEIKMRGADHYGFAQQEQRSQCLLEMAKRKLQTEGFYFKVDGLNAGAIGSLLQDDIICRDPLRGYCFAHDIYQEWAMEYHVDSIWDACQNAEVFISEIGGSLSSVNTFRRWYARAIDRNEAYVVQFTAAMFDGKLEEKWQTAIIIEILRSNAYAKQFFAQYRDVLQGDDFQCALKVLKLLPIYAKDIQTFLTYKGSQYPVMRPVGSGWDSCVDFIYAHHADLAPKAGKLINTILADYPRIKDGDKLTLYKAGLLTLRPHQEAAEIRKKGKSCFFEKEEFACKVTAEYFLYIHKEMQQILQEVVTNRWVKHRAPYNELSTYIVKAEDESALPLYVLHPQEILNLMDLFWCEQPEDEEDDPWGNRHSHWDMEQAWGLSEERLMLMYFPASAQQTCTASMLVVHPQETLDFIIRFVDKCANTYAKKMQQRDAVEAIELVLPDGTKVSKIGNQTFWNLYRGTTGIAAPHVLESIHMALEWYLLEASKDGKTEEVRKYLWDIIKGSRSLSLMSIVASVVVAYPDEYFEEAIVMTSNLQFLKYDLTRYSSEVNASMIEFAFHRHPSMLTERKNANAMKHRKQHLETLLFNIQATYLGASDAEGQACLQRAYQNVDSLKEQLEKEPEEEKTLTKFIISRCDVRAMKKEEVDVNGTKGTLFTPHLDEEQKAMSDDSVRNSNAMMVGTTLRMWASYRAKGDLEKIKGNQYEKDPLKTLDVCKDILKQLETREGGLFLLPGDEYVPATVCAVLLRDFVELLSEEDYDFCVKIVICSLENVGKMVSSSLSEYDTCLQVLGNIIETKPEYTERCLQIIYSYVTIGQEVAGRRACDVVAETIAAQKLWEKHEAEMTKLLKQLIDEKTKGGQAESLNYEDAETVLCLLSVYPVTDDLLHIADVCLERVSHIWDLNDKRKNLYVGHRYSCSYVVARIVLSAPKEEISRLLTYFERYLNTDYHDTFLMSFVLRTMLTGDYERFWTVWYTLYDTVILERDNHFHDEMLNNYMFNPAQYTHWGDDWFRIEEKDMAFFQRIGTDLGRFPIVMRNIVHVSKTIGKKHFIASLEIFNDIVVNNPGLQLKDYTQQTMTDLEAILRRELPNLGIKIKSDGVLRQRLINVLNFMIGCGSSYASFIKSGLS